MEVRILAVEKLTDARIAPLPIRGPDRFACTRQCHKVDLMVILRKIEVK
jgi:hypothetical protein